MYVIIHMYTVASPGDTPQVDCVQDSIGKSVGFNCPGGDYLLVCTYVTQQTSIKLGMLG